MDEIDVSSKLFDAPADRRLWLLHKALECMPLDRAIALAREVEAFVTGGAPVYPKPRLVPLRPDRAALSNDQPGEDPKAVESPEASSRPATQTRLALSDEQRERLMDRLAKGATNAELANEFGLSLRQAQGIRMGTARKKSSIRHVSNSEKRPDAGSELPTSVAEIIRYLRQRDDVVVPQGGGEFLVNGRFHLSAVELASRANKMRSRLGKPEFQLANAGTAEMPATALSLCGQQAGGG
jgi:hypothetical protein